MKIHLVTMLLINNVPLTSQQRRHSPFHQVDASFIEAKYETMITELPEKIGRVRNGIIEDTAVRNMFGYSIALSYWIGATLESAGWLLMKFKSLQGAVLQTFSNLEYFGVQWYMWWYGAGDAGPWYFPDSFGTGGDPYLKCSSEDFIRLVRKYNLDAGVAKISRMRKIENFVLLERLEKDLSEDLGCILHPSYPERVLKEHEAVNLQIQDLTGLIRFHRGLLEESEEDTTDEELGLLDQEISSTWEEMSVVIEEVR